MILDFALIFFLNISEQIDNLWQIILPKLSPYKMENKIWSKSKDSGLYVRGRAIKI
jgi:hypothetical protein